MEICVKISLITIFYLFFWFSIMIVSYTLILPMSQLQTQQLMMSQITSHIQYLVQTYNILFLILYSKLTTNVVVQAVFNTILWRLLIVAFFFGATLYVKLCHFLISSDCTYKENWICRPIKTGIVGLKYKFTYQQVFNSRILYL